MEKSDYLNLYHQMVVIRRLEERAAELYQQGKIGGFLHLYIGQEAVSTGLISVRRPEDRIITAYRDHGIAINCGLSAKEVMAEKGVKIKYLVGTMIEVPRGAMTADQIAAEAQFFSFGTNDLTQMTFGFSRDDIGKFLRVYQDKKIIDKDPFATIDTEGVGAIVRIGVERGRKARPDLKVGICGEHGGDAASIHFFESVKLDYVSASPYRIPVARLAAAQAALAVKVGD